MEFALRDSPHWYWIPAVAASVLLLVASFLGHGPKRESAAARLRHSDLLYLLAMSVFLAALRWPVLSLGDLEGDESVAVSAALTRYLDPAFGVTLFTGSAGPLLTYPLSALGLLGLRIDFGASKLVSLLLITASSAISYLTLRILSESRTARLALLPLLAFIGLGNASWTISYCSEQWINLLVISMIYFLVRLDRQVGGEGVNLTGIGLALGLIPLVKWQGAPMAALVVVCAIAIVTRRCLRAGAGLGGLVTRLTPLAVLGLAPLLVWSSIVWVFGSLGFYFQTYFAALFTQATTRYATTLLQRLEALPEWGLPADSIEPWFVGMTGLFWIPAAIALCFVRRSPRFPSDVALAAVYLLVSLYAVLQPGGPFSHYLNLLLQPYALLFMLIFCHLAQVAARPALVSSAYFGLAVLVPAMGYLREHPLTGRFESAPVRADSLDALRALQISGSPMIQWGWSYVYYLHTGTTWGTRTGGSHEILEDFFPNKGLFMADYVESLESGRAPVFLDTATEGSPAYGIRFWFRHEKFPEVAEVVRRNYFPCADLPGARVYLHRKKYEGRAEIQAWCAGLPQSGPH